MYNFVVLLYVYDQIVISSGVKKNRYSELCNLIDDRMIRNKSYFSKNNIIKTQYNFIRKIVDNMKENAYNINTIEEL